MTNGVGELLFINNSASGITVNSAITNNGTGAVSLTKAGSGLLTLAATGNSFSGGIVITNGTLAYSDSAASLFFQRFAVPMIQYPDVSAKWQEKISAVSPKSVVDVWNMLPGVVIGAFPYVDKRQLCGVQRLRVLHRRVFRIFPP